MKREELLFKLGEISDDIIEEADTYAGHGGKQIPFPRPKRVFRRVAVGVAAVLVLTLGTFAAAMAVDEEFRDSVFAFFHIASADVVLPVEDEDPNWDNDVDHFYSAGVGDAATVEYIRISGDFKLSDGIICRYNDAERTSVSFYGYFTESGVVPVEARYVETQYIWKGKTYDICFDWCVYDGRVGVYARYKESVNDAYWTVEPVSGRTDIVRLTFGGGRAFFFDLEAEAVIDPFAGCGVDELAIINTEFSPDLKKAFLACGHGETVWYCDTEEKTLETVDEFLDKKVDGSWFIDADTLGYYVMDSSYLNTYYARSLLTGDEQVILEDVPLFGSHDSTWGIKPTGDRYGVLVDTDGSVYALDFKTGERNLIEGYTYPTDALTKTIPNGTGDKIAFVSYHNEETGLGISQIGVLDLNARTFTLLDREGYEARDEVSVSWFDEDRIFIWAVMENDNYLYLYTIPALLPPAGEFSDTERAGAGPVQG